MSDGRMEIPQYCGQLREVHIKKVREGMLSSSRAKCHQPCFSAYSKIWWEKALVINAGCY